MSDSPPSTLSPPSLPVVLVCVLGCTGVVGQKFLSLLQAHPYFRIACLCASERSAGRSYEEAVSWKQSSPMPDAVRSMTVHTCDVKHPLVAKATVVFSALDASVAGPIESAMAAAGLKVFSNAKNHRYDDTVPILIPHVNASHLSLVLHQQKVKGYDSGGFIVTNANCSSTGLVVALKPLDERFGLEAVSVVTMQAISGAGYPGVSALDIVDNVIPFVSGEEPKLEMEPLKILGHLNADLTAITPATFAISAQCNRVAVIDGHLECVSVRLRKEASVEDVVEALEDWQSEAQTLQLPSAPARPLCVLRGEARPQPKLDRDLGNGMVVSVGRIRRCPLLSFKFVCLSHNTVLGAAGGSIQNAELAHAKHLL